MPQAARGRWTARRRLSAERDAEQAQPLGEFHRGAAEGPGGEAEAEHGQHRAAMGDVEGAAA